MKAELAWTENGFGLGYYDGKDLSHFFWCEAKGENGPYQIVGMAYRNGDELLELLALIKAFGDQVSSVQLMEPPEVQLQSLLKQPFETAELRKRPNMKIFTVLMLGGSCGCSTWRRALPNVDGVARRFVLTSR